MVVRRTRHGIVALALLLALSVWVSRQQGEPGDLPIEGLDTRFDYTLKNFSMRLFDEDGRPAMVINAPSLANDAVTGIGAIEQPRIQVHHEGALWNIMARQAQVSSDREIVELGGGVRLVRRAGAGTTRLDITTSDVTLEVTPRVAHSRQAVQLVEPGARLGGTGFRVDMLTSQFEIFNQIKGRYDVPQSP